MLWRCARIARQHRNGTFAACHREKRACFGLPAEVTSQERPNRCISTAYRPTQQDLGRGHARCTLKQSQLGDGIFSNPRRSFSLSSAAQNGQSDNQDNWAAYDCSQTITHKTLQRCSPPPVPIKMAGLIRSIRKQKAVAFAHISDGTTPQPYQAIFQPSQTEGLQNGAYVELHGTWAESQGGKQSHELQVSEVLTVGAADINASPIQKKHMTVDHLRAYPHMRMRLNTYAEINKARAQAISTAHRLYASNDPAFDSAIYVQPPIITSSDCEGAGEVFTVAPKLHTSPHKAGSAEQPKQGQHYFRTPKYLTVSSQLHLEAFSAELGNVWTITPAFRAEESDTGRHLSELWMLETELRGSDVTLDHLKAHVEYLVQNLAQSISEATSFPDSDTRLQPLSSSYRTVTYTEIMRELGNYHQCHPHFFKEAPHWEGGLSLEHEKWITEHFAGNAPVFVTHYPRVHKPFYMLPDEGCEAGRETVQCFDLLLPFGICETVGGSLREHRLERLVESMRTKGLLQQNSAVPDTPKEGSEGERSKKQKEESYPFLRDGESLGSLEWYADLRRFGSSPHGGFGLGLDRLLMYLTGVSNVRDIVPFPRTFKNCIA